MTLNRSLTVLVHAESKVGKSTLASTAPYPRLLLDAEMGHRFLQHLNMRYWDPMREAPPVADGSWDTCVVVVHDYNTVTKVYEWLRSGQHQFRSLILDSITEIQDKLFTQLAGNEQLKMQQWGEVLRKLGGLLRNIRDLTTHPTNPLEAVVLTAFTEQDRDGVWRPQLQGALKKQISYLFDVTGAMVTESMPNPDPTQPAYTVRRMYIDRTPKYEAGNRVQGRLGAVVEQQNLNIEVMLDQIFGPRPVAPAVTETPTTQETTTNV